MTSSKDDDKGVTLAGELIAMIRINALRGTFATATVAEIEAHLKPWIDRLLELRAAEIPTQQQAPESLGSPSGSAAHLGDDVTVGQIVRWINREHLQAAKETPPNRDYMKAMQRSASAVESALWTYRVGNPKSVLISCRWSEDEDGNWDTACGEVFVFETGGPTENRAKWCPYCGRRIHPVNFEQNADVDARRDGAPNPHGG